MSRLSSALQLRRRGFLTATFPSRHFSAKTLPAKRSISQYFSDISDEGRRLFKLTRQLLSAAFPTTFDIRYAVIDAQYWSLLDLLILDQLTVLPTTVEAQLLTRLNPEGTLAAKKQITCLLPFRKKSYARQRIKITKYCKRKIKALDFSAYALSSNRLRFCLQTIIIYRSFDSTNDSL